MAEGAHRLNISGKQDGFPAYELWLHDMDSGKNYLLYGFDPSTIGTSALSLYDGYWDQSISVSTSIDQIKSTLHSIKFDDHE